MCDKRNYFCYLCGLFVDVKHRLNLEKNKVLVEAIKMTFNIEFVGSSWYEPEFICSRCSGSLKKWKHEKCHKHPLPFSIPVIWHRILIHKSDDCYFCQTDIAGYSYKNRDRILYADVPSASKPVSKAYGESELDILNREDDCIPEISSSRNDNDPPFIPVPTQLTDRHFISNSDYHDLVRDSGLSWRQTEIIGSRLKQWNLVEKDFKITFSREKNRSGFEELFKIDDNNSNLVYCTDVQELFICFGHEHNPKDWRLFIDGSCKSKCEISCI